MNAEIIAVGSELLLGQITNTNAKFISSQLSELGINVYYHTVVGDNAQRLKDAISVAQQRADLIIFSGGLGPTKDDLTKETIAQHLGIELTYDVEALSFIEDYFTKRGRPMTDNNRKQAIILAGAKVLKNNNGMAPGMILTEQKHTYILLPGPPKELEPMFQYEAKPLLANQLLDDAVILSHVLRYFGIGEAELENKIQSILDDQTNPTVAPLATDGEVTLRITAKAQTKHQANELIEAKKLEINQLVGQYQYGDNDDSLASKLVKLLIERNLTISAAESLTAGLFQSELAEIPGVSATLVGGVVVYNEQAKIKQLGVARELLQQYGVVSAECAAAMANSVRDKFSTDIGIALTGAAGPEAHGDQPAGTVWLAIAFKGQPVETYRFHLSGMRNSNRLRAVKNTCHHLIRKLQSS